jgi:hypothetical protein
MRPGAGLGLAVVHGIVMDSAGGCRVTSRPGAGSSFTVFLPALDGELPTAAAHEFGAHQGAEPDAEAIVPGRSDGSAGRAPVRAVTRTAASCPLTRQ